MYCWIEEEYKTIPWYKRNKDASSIAAISSYNCETIDESRDHNCKCFSNNTSYQSHTFQIKSNIPIVYMNGTMDSQANIEGARRHFGLQKSSNKAFITLCGSGHQLPRMIKSKGEAYSHDRIFGLVFQKNLKKLKGISCEK